MRLLDIRPLLELIRARRQDPTLPQDERALLENFGAEERVGAKRIEAYAPHAGTDPWTILDHLKFAHERRYLFERVNIDKLTAQKPDAFDPELNGENFWQHIDNRVVLYRVESMQFALSGTGLDEQEFKRAIEHQASPDRATQELGREVLSRVADSWNERRDRRPLFATTHDEVGEVLRDAQDDWPHALREHLGLGHLNPVAGKPMTVLLMKYTVDEVRKSKAGDRMFCVPTVLDGPLNACFFPTPKPGPGAEGSDHMMGRTVNLRDVTDRGAYRMGLELVHSYLDYRPQHFVRWGTISRPVSSDLAKLRQFHLASLREMSGRDTFGCELAHV